MQRGTQGINICTRSCLCFAILFRGSIAWRAESNGIPGLSWLKVAGYAKVNQVDLPMWCQQNISRFEIAEDDGRLARMQVTKHRTELNTDIKNLLNR